MARHPRDRFSGIRMGGVVIGTLFLLLVCVLASVAIADWAPLPAVEPR